MVKKKKIPCKTNENVACHFLRVVGEKPAVSRGYVRQGSVFLPTELQNDSSPVRLPVEITSVWIKHSFLGKVSVIND